MIVVASQAIAAEVIVTTTTTTTITDTYTATEVQTRSNSMCVFSHCPATRPECHTTKVLAWNNENRVLQFGNRFNCLSTLTEKKQSNNKIRCDCCGRESVESLTVYVDHYRKGKCTFIRVAQDELEHVREAALQFITAYDTKDKKSEAAEAQPTPQVGPKLWAEMSVKKVIGAGFTIDNMPANRAEGDGFKLILHSILEHSDHLSHDFIDSINRHMADKQKKSFSKEVAEEELARLMDAMEKLKYSLTVSGDGWKGRNVDDNCLGVLLSSLQRVYVVGNFLSKEAGTAVAYLEKLKTVIGTLEKVHFACFDGAANMVKLLQLLEEQFCITGSLCVCHGLSLVMRHLAKVFDDHFHIVAGAKALISYFRGKREVTARFADILKRNGQSAKFPTTLCETRFAYNSVSYQRLLELRPYFALYFMEGQTLDLDENGKDVANLIQNQVFWSALEVYVEISLPCLMMMRLFDSSAPFSGFVYWSFEVLEAEVKLRLTKLKMLDTPFGRSCVDVFNLVFAKRLRAVDLLCYVTNPALVRWFDEFYPTQTEWQNALFTLVCKVRMINGQTWDMKDPKTKQEVFVTSSLLTHEINKLRQGQRGSNNEFAWYQASEVHPVTWYELNGESELPNLMPYAILLLSRAVQSSVLERFFSKVSLVQSKIANRLSVEKAGEFASQAWKNRQGLARAETLVKSMSDMMAVEKNMWNLLHSAPTNTAATCSTELEQWVGQTFQGEIDVELGDKQEALPAQELANEAVDDFDDDLALLALRDACRKENINEKDLPWE